MRLWGFGDLDHEGWLAGGMGMDRARFHAILKINDGGVGL
jgi:hypothetical protein